MILFSFHLPEKREIDYEHFRSRRVGDVSFRGNDNFIVCKSDNATRRIKFENIHFEAIAQTCVKWSYELLYANIRRNVWSVKLWKTAHACFRRNSKIYVVFHSLFEVGEKRRKQNLNIRSCSCSSPTFFIVQYALSIARNFVFEISLMRLNYSLRALFSNGYC